MAKPLILTNKKIDISIFRDVVFFNRKVSISNETLKKLDKDAEYLEMYRNTHFVYGVNTGFGPMANTYIKEEKQIELQYNLIRSHAMGLGERIDNTHVRAMLFTRLQSLLQGHSAIKSEVCNILVYFLNNNILPVIYEHGSVGASGDLVQLSHVAESLIGEGLVFYNGEIIPTKKVFELHKKKISPLCLSQREALALINGTSAMTAIAGVCVDSSQKLMQTMVYASAILFEIVGASEDYFSKKISDVRPHVGQKYIGSLFRDILKSSARIQKSGLKKLSIAETTTERNVQSLSETKEGSSTVPLQKSIQEVYSIRCVIQILGPIFEEVLNAKRIFEIELNSVTDNPVFFENTQVVHGGNFHGDYISYEMDKLKIAITKMSMLTERQLQFLLNNKVNMMFTPFLNMGTVGLDLGLQGLQFVATSTVAENQTLSNPTSVHSISCNNDNQDIVSMGTNSAQIAHTVIENTFQVLAIQLYALSRAVLIKKIEHDMSAETLSFLNEIRSCVKGKGDLVQRDDIQRIVDYIKQKPADF